MMYPIALTALGIGCVTGWALASRFMLRTLAFVLVCLVSLVVAINAVPATALPGQGFAAIIAAYLVAPPMAAGLVGGAIFRWLLRSRAKPS